MNKIFTLLLLSLASPSFAALTPVAGSGAVDSVNGQTGVVNLVTDDIPESGSPTNKYFTDARAKNACVLNTLAGSQTDQAPSVASVNTALGLKEPTIAAGTSGQYYRGDKSMQSLAPAVNAALPALSTLNVGKLAGADSSTCGAVSRPCLTIQQALTNIGDSVTAADVKKPYAVLIEGGIYDEALTMPNGRIITLFALGTVVLGNGAGSNWASTNSRSITQTFNTADLQGSDIKPALNIVSLADADMTSTFIAESGGFFISGNLNITGDGVTNTLNTYNVKVAGNIVHTDSSLTNWQSKRTIVAGTVTTTGNLVLERAQDSRFNGLLSVNAVNEAFNSNFAGGITVQSVQQNLLPNGFFHCNIAGTFTGPASSARFDDETDYFFTQNAATLAGGATKVRLSPNYSTLQQSLVGSQPACSVSNRGLAYLVLGGAGVADIYQVCQKDAADAYGWVTH